MKSVARTTKTPQDDSVNSDVVGAWVNSRELLADIHRSLSSFQDGSVEPESARIMVSHFKVAAAVFTMELEHARITKRLIEGSTVLPMIEFSGK